MSETLPRPDDPERDPKAVSRRALIRAGWALPVVLASVALPTRAFAQYANNGGNGGPIL